MVFLEIMDAEAIHVLLKASGAIPEELSRIRAISSQITILSSYEKTTKNLIKDLPISGNF